MDKCPKGRYLTFSIPDNPGKASISLDLPLALTIRMGPAFCDCSHKFSLVSYLAFPPPHHYTVLFIHVYVLRIYNMPRIGALGKKKEQVRTLSFKAPLGGSQRSYVSAIDVWEGMWMGRWQVGQRSVRVEQKWDLPFHSAGSGDPQTRRGRAS